MTGSQASLNLRGSALLLAGRFLGIGTNLLIQVLVVRGLSQTAFGSLAYCLAVANLLMVVVSLGMDQTISRFAALYDEQRRPERLAGAVLVYLSVTVVLGVLVVGVVVAGRSLLTAHLVPDAQTASLLAVMVLLAPLQAVDSLVVTLFAVYARPVAIFWRRYVLAPGLRLVALIVVLAAGADLEVLGWGYVAALALGLAVYTYPLVRLLRRNGVFGQRPEWPWRDLLRFTAGSIAADLLVIVLFASDVIILGRLRGPEAVAVLQVAQPVANGNLVVFYALIPLFVPTAARLFGAGDLAGATRLYSRCTLWIAVFTFPVLALTVPFATPVSILLFGERYAEAGPVLALLALGQFTLAAFGLTTLTLKAHGRLRLLALANVAVAVVNLAVNLAVAPRYGPVGVAAGTVGCLVLLTFLKCVIMRYELAIWPADRAVVRGLVGIGCGVLALAAIQLTWSPPVPLAVLLTALAFGGLLRANRGALAADEVFPELRRLPVLRTLLCR